MLPERGGVAATPPYHLLITSFVKYLPNLVFVTILGKTISLGREQFFPS